MESIHYPELPDRRDEGETWRIIENVLHNVKVDASVGYESTSEPISKDDVAAVIPVDAFHEVKSSPGFQAFSENAIAEREQLRRDGRSS